MNENPGETPNPLNPNFGTDAGAVGATPGPAPGVNPGPTARPIRVTETATTEFTEPAGTMTEGETLRATIESLDPTGRPMEQVSEPLTPPKKKKKTGLIVGIIIAVFLLVGCGVAAALVLINNNTDAVSAAMNKIMSGGVPSNVAVDGTIDIRSNDPDSPLERVKIDLDSELMTNSMINTSTAIVTLSIANMPDVSFEFDEVYAESGDLYLKLDGATGALEDSGLLQLLAAPQPVVEPVDCLDDEEGCVLTEVVDCADGEEDCLAGPVLGEVEILDATNCVNGDADSDATNCVKPETEFDSDLAESLTPLLGIIETIDGEWLRISTDEMSMLSGDMLNDSDVSCITDLVSSIDTNSSSAADLYGKYPFITSSSENLNVASKNDPIYKISVDDEAFANFVNGIDNANLSQSLYSCLGWENKVSITATDVNEITANFPVIYAEVDDNHNFTRLYLESDTDDADATMVIDLSFRYPTTVNVVEPDEYMDFSEVIQAIFSSMYDLGDDVVVEEDITTEDGVTTEVFEVTE